MKKVKLAFLPLLALLAATTISCETDNEGVENTIETTETSEARTFVTAYTGQETVIPLGWGDEESAEIITEPGNAAVSELQLPYNYVYKSESGFEGRERVRVRITDHLEGTSRVEVIIINVEIPLVGVIFN